MPTLCGEDRVRPCPGLFGSIRCGSPQFSVMKRRGARMVRDWRNAGCVKSNQINIRLIGKIPQLTQTQKWLMCDILVPGEKKIKFVDGARCHGINRHAADGRMAGCVSGWMDGWMGLDGWMDRWMDRLMVGWIDE